MPHVSVKQDFLRCPPPKAKGHGVERSSFPNSLRKDVVDHPDFKAYMEHYLNKKGNRLKKLYIGATRALGALNLTTHPDKPFIVITDVDVLVALYTQDEHLKLLNCPLLSPCYSWTIELLDGLDVYCQFHQKQLRDKEIKGEEVHHVVVSSSSTLHPYHHHHHHHHQEVVSQSPHGIDKGPGEVLKDAIDVARELLESPGLL